jgi:Na+-transporting NADH:ubiquinone oxidoreductase subunit NqrC
LSGYSLLFVCSIQRWGQVDLFSKDLRILAEVAKNLHRTTYRILTAVRKKLAETSKVILMPLHGNPLKAHLFEHLSLAKMI